MYYKTKDPLILEIPTSFEGYAVMVLYSEYPHWIKYTDLSNKTIKNFIKRKTLPEKVIDGLPSLITSLLGSGLIEIRKNIEGELEIRASQDLLRLLLGFMFKLEQCIEK